MGSEYQVHARLSSPRIAAGCGDHLKLSVITSLAVCNLAVFVSQPEIGDLQVPKNQEVNQEDEKGTKRRREGTSTTELSKCQASMPDWLKVITGKLPEDFAAAADWKLKMHDGGLISCHSQCLAAVSPVLAVILRTENENDRVCVPLPAHLDSKTVAVFLRWLYRLEFWSLMTPDLAHDLALLANEWNIQGAVLQVHHSHSECHCPDYRKSLKMELA